jgi:Ni/Fe-hydrogenase subunit HybB-like protein
MTHKVIFEEIKSYPRFIKLLILLVLAAAFASLVRLVFGLGATTNLSDLYPWGLWISFDVVTAVPLAAGAFTIGVVAEVCNIKRLKPLVRPAIVTGFLGYSLVAVGLLIDLGQPQRFWHTLIYWNLHSPMFEVSVCIMCYTTVLFLEFLQPVAEKFGWKVSLKVLRTLEIPFAIAAASISSLHQSSLGTFFLSAVDKLHPLWYNPLLPALFFLSALFTGLSIVIVEATAVHRHMGQPEESDLLAVLAGIIPWLLGLYLVAKLLTLAFLSGRPLFDRPALTVLFAVEMIIGVILPLLIFLRKENRKNPTMQYAGALMIIAGTILNRFNVSMFGMVQLNQKIYYPSLVESVVTIGIIAAHILLFYIIAKYFPIFVHHPEAAEASLPDRVRKVSKSAA